MGKTFVVFKVTVDDMDNLDKVEKSLRGLKNGMVKDVKREPIGYGIEILKVGILFEEKQEKMEESQQEIRAIPLVEDVEVETMTLL